MAAQSDLPKVPGTVPSTLALVAALSWSSFSMDLSERREKRGEERREKREERRGEKRGEREGRVTYHTYQQLSYSPPRSSVGRALDSRCAPGTPGSESLGSRSFDARYKTTGGNGLWLAAAALVN